MSNISRRDFLKTAGVMSLAVALAGCDTAASSSSSSSTPAVVTPTTSNEFTWTQGHNTLKVTAKAYGHNYLTTGVQTPEWVVFTFDSSSSLINPDDSTIDAIEIRDQANRVVSNWESVTSTKTTPKVYPVFIDLTGATLVKDAASTTGDETTVEGAMAGIKVTQATGAVTAASHDSTTHGNTKSSVATETVNVCYLTSMTIHGTTYGVDVNAESALKITDFTDSSSLEAQNLMGLNETAGTGKIYGFIVDNLLVNNTDYRTITVYENYAEAYAAASQSITYTINCANELKTYHGVTVSKDNLKSSTSALSFVNQKFSYSGKTDIMVHSLFYADNAYNGVNKNADMYEISTYTVYIYEHDTNHTSTYTLTVPVTYADT